MEFCALGDLSSHVSKTIEPALRDTWINQLVLGLQYMHRLYVCHRDIKTVRHGKYWCFTARSRSLCLYRTTF
jgi:serine/threonine protein kinase